MTERQKLIAHKQSIQFAKRILSQIEGIQIVQLFQETEPQGLNELYTAYIQHYTYDNSLEPYSRLDYQSSPQKIYSWVMDTLKLSPKTKYFIHCGVWAEIEILDTVMAVQSLWTVFSHNFLLIKSDLSVILEVGLDSRDESHYLIDIWNHPNKHL